MPTRILVVDDHDAVRKGIRDLLHDHDDVEIIDEASNGQEAIERTNELLPDLIIMDVTMPVLDGFQAATMIKKLHPEIAIVMLTMHNFRGLNEAAKQLHLNGFITKSDGGIALFEAIKAIQHNETYFPG